MACRNAGMEWVETTEEVVITEECLSPEDNPPAELEPAETPIQKLLDTVGPGDVPEADGGFYCEECLTLFQDHSDPANIHGPSFILDFPSSTGVPQRALLTLPYGLMIGRSSIPGAGVGVINQETVSPGMHFGPFEGEVTTRENAVASCASWEIYKDDGEYEYIDAATESHSNWMRYINCARSKDETNLLAVQYKGSILYHCCRAIRPGDELLVWPGAAFLGRFSEAWTEAWLAKLNARGNSDGAATQVFVCSRCQLTFTTESFLQRHAENFHAPPEGDNATPANTESVESRTCSDCGKTFKQIPHLKRHRLCVHSNKRPYCCPHCRRSFSQASGLIRHQLVHRKRAVRKDTEAAATQEESVSEEKDESSENVAAATDESTNVEEETERTCSDCSKNFKNEASLKKHKVMVHERLRPYVCTVCQKCFGQCNDLTRHLRLHKKQNQGAKKALEESTAMPFSCGECSLSVSSVDALQQHIAEHHSQEDAAAGNQEDVDEDQSHDPDFSPPALAAETAESTQKRERPQRRGAGSKISAITKLIAPKRRAVVFTKPASDAERSAADPEGSRKLTKYKWFSCNRCKRTYGNPDDLKTHKCALKPLKCAQCGATFTKSGFLKRHEQMAHGNAKSYSCDRCGKVFTTSGNLKQHQKSNACTKYYCTEELHACPFCQFSFTMKSYLTKHIKRHHPVEFLSHGDTASLAERLEEDEEEDEAGKKYDCPHCDKSCESAKAFKSHTCFQQVKVLYLCTDCGKGFTNHYALKQHQRIHTGEKPYVCPHCGKRFSYTGQLNVHLRTHTGEKPYLCTHCGESFRQSGDLKRHERKHTGVRPYSCPECCKSFSRPQSLKAHQMLHLGQRMFKCNQCGKSFSRNYHLRRHHQKMHL